MAEFNANVRASRIWLSALILGLILSQGVAPLLRGAAVGLERWIDTTDFVAAWVTQVVGVVGSLLILRLLVDALRDVPRRRSSALVAAFGFLPGFVVLVAAEGPVFGPLQHLSAVSVVALGALVTLARLFADPRAAIVPFLAVVSCGCRLLLASETALSKGAVLVAWLGALATLLTLLFALALAITPRARKGPSPDRKTRNVAQLGVLSGTGFSFAHLSITKLVDPAWAALFARGPTMVGVFALALPLSAYLIWFPTVAYKNPSTSLLLLASVCPLSPLGLAAATLGFLLMHLTQFPRKYGAISSA
jgi:hypothetical protein